MTTYVLALSVMLQFAAAIMAFKLIRLTGERVAWGFIATAIMLMAVRRCISLIHLIDGVPSFKADLPAEVIALAISVLLVVGIARIAPFFSSIKRSEERAQQAAKIIEEGRSMYRTLAENLPGIVYRVFIRENNRMQFFNKAAESISGYSDRELAAGEICSLESLILAEDRDKVRAAIDSAIAGREPYGVEYRIRRKDGDIDHLLERGTPIFGVDGAPLYLDGVIFDITERKRAEEEVRKLNQELERRVAERTVELERANQELEAFSYSVSHDLRAPLRAIDGFSHILTEDYSGVLDDEGRRHLDTIRRNAIRMSELIDDILDFARMSKRELAVTPVDMAVLAREVFEEVRGAAPERNIVLRLGELPQALGDRAMLRQVLVNLLANAAKFTVSRTEAVIDVDGVVEGEEIAYRVKDNGVGFDMRYADKLFGVFQRLHSAEEFEGTGIGLAIVKRIVARHGGRVWAEGRLGEGATIYFTLPSGGRSTDKER